jgi:hypothetical protein
MLWRQHPLTPVESILFWGPWIICNFNSGASMLSVFKEIYKGAFIESMMGRVGSRKAIIVMYVGESISC